MPRLDFRLEILENILLVIERTQREYRRWDQYQLLERLQEEDFAHTTAANIYLTLFMQFDLQDNDKIFRAAFIESCKAAVESMVGFILNNMSSEDDLRTIKLMAYSNLIIDATLDKLIKDGIFPSNGADADQIERWTQDDPTVIRTGEYKRFKRDYLTNYASTYYKSGEDLLEKFMVFAAHLYAYKSKEAGCRCNFDAKDQATLHSFLIEAQPQELEEIDINVFEQAFLPSILSFFNDTARHYFNSAADSIDPSRYNFEINLNMLIKVAREQSFSLLEKLNTPELVRQRRSPRLRF